MTPHCNNEIRLKKLKQNPENDFYKNRKKTV